MRGKGGGKNEDKGVKRREEGGGRKDIHLTLLFPSLSPHFPLIFPSFPLTFLSLSPHFIHILTYFPSFSPHFPLKFPLTYTTIPIPSLSPHFPLILTNFPSFSLHFPSLSPHFPSFPSFPLKFPLLYTTVSPLFPLSRWYGGTDADTVPGRPQESLSTGLCLRIPRVIISGTLAEKVRGRGGEKGEEADGRGKMGGKGEGRRVRGRKGEEREGWGG